ncbi:unnamed protein product [Cochlearia groenlandica]
MNNFSKIQFYFQTMAQKNQPTLQTKTQALAENLVKNKEQDSTTVMNLVENSNRKQNATTMLLAMIFIFLGQSIGKLLEDYYYHQNNPRDDNGVWVWFRYLYQTFVSPLSLLPFLILIIIRAKQKSPQQPPMTFHGFHYKTLSAIYTCIGIIMSVQGRLSAMGKLDISFGVFTLIYTTQLIFAPIFARFINNIETKLCLIKSASYSFKSTESTTEKPSFASAFGLVICFFLVAFITQLQLYAKICASEAFYTSKYCVYFKKLSEYLFQ